MFFVLINLIFFSSAVFFAQETTNNPYILKHNFHNKFNVLHGPLPYNCFIFEAFHSEENDFDDIYDFDGENPIVQSLKIIILFYNQEIFDIKILDSQNKRFEIPSKPPFPKDMTLSYSCENIENIFSRKQNISSQIKFPIHVKETANSFVLDNPNLLYQITIVKQPFAIKAQRKSTGEMIYNTENTTFIYTDKYIEFYNKISTNFLMGLGERNYKSRLNVGEVYTTWCRDEPNEIEDGKPPGKNIYGYHPIYLSKENSGAFNIGYLRISNAFDTFVGENYLKLITVYYY